MKNLDFPIFNTKTSEGKIFDLTDAKARQEYFEYKAGPEIKKLREYFKDKTFIAYFLGKKSSGKGTYSKMFAEIIDKDKIAHFSIGDMIRELDGELKDPVKRKELVSFLEKNYRGFLSLDEILKSLDERSTKVLLPSELILTLAKREIEKLGRKTIFVDGFPRDLDQMSYSLYFKDLINYRNDPDVFVLIDVPTAVIDERVKFRVICPLCQTSRNLKLLPTKNIEYDVATNKFYLLCDNSDCESVKSGKGVRMVTKEGDEHGIAPIQERLAKDDMLLRQTMKIQGVPKVLLRNSMPADKIKDFTDDYEVTPEYVYQYNQQEKKVESSQRPWEVQDDDGIASNSLFPPPVVVSLIKQLVTLLGI